MASIERRSGRWRVRWRDPDGRARSRSCPDKRTAERVARQVEQAAAEGRRWEPAGVRQEPSLEDLLKAYLRDCSRALGGPTVERYATALDLFLRWLKRRHGGHVTGAVLSRTLLAEYFDDLATGGRHGRPRPLSTRRKLVENVQRAWRWLHQDDDLSRFVPPPRSLRMPSPPRERTVAPTWAEMDACLDALNGWQKQLGIVLRFTGLRVQQVMGLTWDDVDLDRCLLRVRPELGKSDQERRGRIIPVSAHLTDLLAAFARHDEPWIVHSKRHRGSPRERMARARDFARAWARAGVREDVWRKRPHHSMRKGLVSGLRRLGADPDAVAFLVGHSLGLRGVYTDPAALPLRAAVDLIPALGESPPVDDAEPRFEGLPEADDNRPLREITLDGSRWIQPDRPSRPCPRRVRPNRVRRGNVVFVGTWGKSGGEGGIRTRPKGGTDSLPERERERSERSGGEGGIRTLGGV